MHASPIQLSPVTTVTLCLSFSALILWRFRIIVLSLHPTVNKILSKDEFPNESVFEVLDGNSYDITITKGGVKKEYYANDVTIETYPLLRYLASWCRRR